MFAPEALAFYDALAANNSRDWWGRHRTDYTRLIREPMLALIGALEDEFGPGKVYRPNRDMRFSKIPYKDHCGAFVAIEDGVGYYVQISASGLLVAGGWYSPQGRQLARFRAAVDSLEIPKLPGFTIDGAPGLASDAPAGGVAGRPRRPGRRSGLGVLAHEGCGTAAAALGLARLAITARPDLPACPGRYATLRQLGEGNIGAVGDGDHADPHV